jgi:hypothetical protein
MKKLLSWIGAWSLLYAGCVAYWILTWFDDHELWVKLWYPVYNGVMIASGDIQDWADGHGRRWPWNELSQIEETLQVEDGINKEQ